jgi:branched-chain amino acid transport system permease protein
MVILGGIGNVWGVVFGGVVMGAFNLILTEQATGWLHSVGDLTGLGFLQHADLSSSKFMIYGVALILMMLLRPEGVFPNRQRQAEMTEARTDATAAVDGAATNGALGTAQDASPAGSLRADR